MPGRPDLIRIAFLDISPLMQDLLETTFKCAPNLQSVGCYEDPEALIDAFSDINPHVVVVGRPRSDVLQLVQRLLLADPRVAVLTLLQNDRDMKTYKLKLHTETREGVSAAVLAETIRASRALNW